MRRKWLRRLGLGLLITAGVLVAGALLEWQITHAAGEGQARALEARLDTDDPGWRLGDLHAARNARLPPPERNPAAAIEAAFPLIPPAFHEWAGREQLRPRATSNRLPDPGAAAEAAGSHAECAAALAALYRLRPDTPGGTALDIDAAAPLDFSLKHLERLRRAAALLALDAATHAHAGRTREALNACAAIMTVADAIGDEPTLVSQLVRAAVTDFAVAEAERALALAPPGKGEGLADLQARFLAERDVPRLVYAYRGERAVVAQILTPGNAGAAAGLTSLGGGLTAWYFRKHVPEARAMLIECFNALLASAELPDGERSAATRAAVAAAWPKRTIPGAEILVGIFMPAAEAIDDAESRLRARLGCAAVALACERYRLHNGRWPNALADLPPGLLAAVPADPYTGKPLSYKLLPGGAAVYAVGPDGVDDGAADLRADLGRRDKPGADIGFRLYDPAERRAPPLPAPADPE